MPTASNSEIPPHIDPSRVFVFDLFMDERLKNDVHLGLKQLHRDAPDIFYTPLNGGHWMVTRHQMVSDILKDFEHFSNEEMDIPRMGNSYKMIPLNLDPPEHAPYRAILMRYFSPKVVKEMEGQLRAWAGEYIDEVLEDRSCDITTIGTAFPVQVFMRMMGLPLERFEEFRSIVVEYFGLAPVARRNEMRGWISDLMRDYYEQRSTDPRDDLITKLTQEEINGGKLTMLELQSIGFFLFVAGLDTVANAIAFCMLHLAKDPELQAGLVADPGRIADFVEESLRRYSVVNGSRTVKQDFEYGGVLFRKGDMVCLSNPCAGMDERINPDPMKFDIDRTGRRHTAFSVGPHLCVGHYLARAEMRIFVDEWLKRVPSFRLVPGSAPVHRAGKVMSVKHVDVEWDSTPAEAVAAALARPPVGSWHGKL